MEEKKKIKIAFDLDGVIIDKPPFIPKKTLECLFRGGSKNSLYCRFPKSKINQELRKLSHFQFLRQPIKPTINIINELNENQDVEMYIISSRYSFLNNQTKKWLSKNDLLKKFKKILLNDKNNQPVIFKEKSLEQIKPDFYLDDDEIIITYLKKKLTKINFIFFTIGDLTKIERILLRP